jgi:hypothetical protein
MREKAIADKILAKIFRKMKTMESGKKCRMTAASLRTFGE